MKTLMHFLKSTLAYLGVVSPFILYMKLSAIHIDHSSLCDVFTKENGSSLF